MDSIKKIIVFAVLLLSLASCSEKGTMDTVAEDVEAKEMLQGIWLSEEGTVNMRIAGDTIYYSDTEMLPVGFCVMNDTLVIDGVANKSKYAIVERTTTNFSFKNNVGDVLSYVRSDNVEEDKQLFERKDGGEIAINQCKLIKRDTVLTVGEHKYHAYIQVNPSSYKVVMTTYNADGFQVENVYYDNIINICLYDGGTRLYSKDFKKQDFSKLVPEEYLAQSVLSDVLVEGATETGMTFFAYICVPNSSASYVVKVDITKDGKMSMRI